jgi:hypothetical protein
MLSASAERPALSCGPISLGTTCMREMTAALARSARGSELRPPSRKPVSFNALFDGAIARLLQSETTSSARNPHTMRLTMRLCKILTSGHDARYRRDARRTRRHECRSCSALRASTTPSSKTTALHSQTPLCLAVPPPGPAPQPHCADHHPRSPKRTTPCISGRESPETARQDSPSLYARQPRSSCKTTALHSRYPAPGMTERRSPSPALGTTVCCSEGHSKPLRTATSPSSKTTALRSLSPARIEHQDPGCLARPAEDRWPHAPTHRQPGKHGPRTHDSTESPTATALRRNAPRTRRTPPVIPCHDPAETQGTARATRHDLRR